MRIRKQATNLEETNIETNYQKTLAEYTRRLEETKEELKHLKNTLHDIKQDRKILKSEEKQKILAEIYSHTYSNKLMQKQEKQI